MRGQLAADFEQCRGRSLRSGLTSLEQLDFPFSILEWRLLFEGASSTSPAFQGFPFQVAMLREAVSRLLSPRVEPIQRVSSPHLSIFLPLPTPVELVSTWQRKSVSISAVFGFQFHPERCQLALQSVGGNEGKSHGRLFQLYFPVMVLAFGPRVLACEPARRRGPGSAAMQMPPRHLFDQQLSSESGQSTV